MRIGMTIFTKKNRKLGLIGAGFLLLSFGVDTMAGILGSNTLFSEVEGVVTINGTPCVSAKIEQHIYKSDGKELLATVKTDENGRFKFKGILESKGVFSFLPSEFVVTQRLVIYYEDKEYLGWANAKRSPESNVESNGKQFYLVCDLSKHPEEDDKYTGICRLKN
jgi:hypothetical protein